MLPRNLAETTPQDIQALIDSEVSESLTLEYKSELPGSQSDQKREFLCDIAAMANAAGGDIVYGIADRRGDDNQSTGIADGLSGMRLPNPQSEISRLENLIRDGISPRLAGISIQHVSCTDGDILIVRVPRSWDGPQMVTIGSLNRFYGRVSTGKYLMSVEQIRRAFSEERELGETIRAWRSHRAELAVRGGGPIPTNPKVTFLFHVIPASAFARNVLSESWSIPKQDQFKIYCTHEAYESRYNADGFLRVSMIGNEPYGYTQIFRSGIVEYADLSCCYSPNEGANPTISGQVLEQRMISCYEDAVNRFRQQGRTDPLYIGFSLTGVLHKTFYISMMSIATHAIEQDIFTSPETLADLNDPEEKPYGKTLLPLVNTMWQLAGREGTPFKNKSDDAWNPFGRFY